MGIRDINSIMKYLIFLIFFLFTNILFANELVVDCKKGKWKGSWLSTSNNKVQADGENTADFARTTYYIETPIVVGDSSVIVVYDGKPNIGVVAHYFDKNNFTPPKPSGYVVVTWKETDIFTVDTIQIPTGMVVTSYTKQLPDFDSGDPFNNFMLSTQSLSKKCKVKVNN